MQRVRVLIYFKCLHALEQRQCSEEEHVVDHEAEKWLELEVRRADWRVPHYASDLLQRPILLDEVDPP